MAGVNTSYNINDTLANRSTTVKKDIVDKDIFLRILTTELTHQDPMNAKDNTQYISQLAQFTSLEQTQNLNNLITKMLSSQRLTEGAALIGKEVEFKLSDDSFVSDVVKSVRVEGSEVYLITVSDKKYSIDQVSEVKNTSATAEDAVEVINQTDDQSQVGDVEVDQQNTEQL